MFDGLTGLKGVKPMVLLAKANCLSAYRWGGVVGGIHKIDEHLTDYKAPIKKIYSIF
jgi:hypothetical protein